MTEMKRQDAMEILSSAIQRVDPFLMIEKAVKIVGDRLVIETESERCDFDLGRYRRVVVTGAGKATAPMARAIEKILGDRLSEGVIAVKPGHGDTLNTIRSIHAGHPVPDDGSIEAAQAILQLARTADRDTLVLNLISGGGSALLTAPFQDETTTISLDDMRRTTEVLLSCGATIQEINCVRKHLSAIKGGRLAQALYPATVVSLILSDVVGDDLSSIASGITAPDNTSFTDVDRVFRRYDIRNDLPSRVVALLERGLRGDIPDTPGLSDEVFASVQNILLGSNAQALLGAEATASELGYNTVVLTSQVTGEAREIARFYAGIARDIRRSGSGLPALVRPPACVIAGGETTVTIRGTGKGGRNQEMTLAFLSEFHGDENSLRDILFVSGATDGNDGPTDAAGGFADSEALHELQTHRIDPMDVLARSDSYHALETIGALVKTGPTNTNVCDIQILIVR